MPQAHDSSSSGIRSGRGNDNDSACCNSVGAKYLHLHGHADKIRICHEKSKYGFVFTRRGLTIESCASYFLPRLVGFSRAMYLISTGGTYPPLPRHFGDLFTETLPDAAKVVSRAIEIAEDMAANASPLASSMSRSLMWEGPTSPEAAHLLESRVFHHMIGQRYVVRDSYQEQTLIRSRDYKEGVSSFLEKRQAEFQTDPRLDSSPNYPWWPAVDTTLEPKKDSKL